MKSNIAIEVLRITLEQKSKEKNVISRLSNDDNYIYSITIESEYLNGTWDSFDEEVLIVSAIKRIYLLPELS